MSWSLALLAGRKFGDEKLWIVWFWETMNDISWTDMVEDLYIYMYINIHILSIVKEGGMLRC